jgi:hypothetical protein
MNTTSKLRWINLITKVNLFIIFILIQSWLLDMCETVPDRWFLTWLAGTVFCAAFIIILAVWIADTIHYWNKQ